MSGNGPQSATSPSALNAYTIAFEGNSVACILYGVYIVIAGANLSLLRKKRYRILLTYTIVQLAITTVYFAVSLYTAPAQSLAIVGVGGSYGPDALSPWPSVIVTVMFTLNTWASDGFLLYRCYVVCMANACAVVVPCLLYLVTFGASLGYAIVSSTPGAVYTTRAVQIAGFCYWSCSAAMNVCASCLISVRFWMHRRALMRAIGHRQGTFYLGYMAMTLESAALYTVFAIVALIAFASGSPLENVFFPTLGMIQVIAPAVIIYRIARGISLETDERGTAMTGSLRFSDAGPVRPVMHPIHRDFFDGSGTMHGSSGETEKLDHDGSNSFIQHVKDDSHV